MTFGAHENETDVLPYARQFFDPEWLPKDWYLNLASGYRYLFNLAFGPLLHAFSFDASALAIRLFLYLVLAVSLRSLCRSLALSLPLFLLVVFYFLHNQSLVAGEWIVGGSETKVLAYAFVFLSMSAVLSGRLRTAFAHAGAAVSFHVLVGMYSLFCLTAMLFIDNRSSWPKWKTTFRSSWPFFITGAVGILVALGQVQESSRGQFARAWEIYVEYRNPHHLVPAFWEGHWVPTLVVMVALFLVMLFRARDGAVRSLVAYALGSVFLFLSGLAIYSMGLESWLRFYPFRVPDVMVQLVSAILVGVILADVLGGRATLRGPRRLRPGTLPPLASRVLRGAVVGVVAFQFIHAGLGLQARYEKYAARQTRLEAWTEADDPEAVPLMKWVATSTPRGAVFLIDPTLSDFYIHAERAVLVSFKHIPSRGRDILEWYLRIVLANNGKPPSGGGFASAEALTSNYQELDAESLVGISEMYGIDYYFARTRSDLDFEQVHETHGYSLYRIPPRARS